MKSDSDEEAHENRRARKYQKTQKGAVPIDTTKLEGQSAKQALS